MGWGNLIVVRTFADSKKTSEESCNSKIEEPTLQKRVGKCGLTRSKRRCVRRVREGVLEGV